MSTAFHLLELIPCLKSWLTLPPLGYNCKMALVCTWEEKKKGQSGRNQRETFIFLFVFDCLVVPGKKKVWNWVSYLEEERMPAAPLKLFREVGSFFNSSAMFLVRQHHRITNTVEVGLEPTLKPAVTFMSCFGAVKPPHVCFQPWSTVETSICPVRLIPNQGVKVLVGSHSQMSNDCSNLLWATRDKWAVRQPPGSIGERA